jgi:3-hydroxymyristoyl/3-hydroxydecanoyl-(acyl carrier protein) dehydratases
MLRGILYEIITVDADGATVRLLPDSPIYQGHFPGYPITPGVCLVEIAVELMREMAGQAGHDDGKAGQDIRFVGAKNIKFTSPVIPDGKTPLRFNLSGEGSVREVEVLFGDALSAKMSLSVA